MPIITVFVLLPSTVKITFTSPRPARLDGMRYWLDPGQLEFPAPPANSTSALVPPVVAVTFANDERFAKAGAEHKQEELQI